MHSLKNTIVAVGLLGLSFVFYQMSAPGDGNFEELELPEVTEIGAELAEVNAAEKFPLPSLKSPLQTENGRSGSSSSSLASRTQDRLELPALKITNPLASPKPNLNQPKLTLPKLVQPKLNQPKISAPEFQPRPEAKFDFTRKSGQPNAQNRDQGLITALKSQSPGGNTFQPNSQVPAQTASFIKDSAVVGASGVENKDGANQFQLNPTSNDPHANLNVKTVWPVVEKLIAENKFRKPLLLLSRFYDDPSLTGPQQQRLDAWLDALATKVIFSNEHHLAPVYISQPGDTYVELGRQWGVPGQLIYLVNKTVPVPNQGEFVPVLGSIAADTPDQSNFVASSVIPPGTKLKKITGPINATISLDSSILTLFVDGMYAGRFSVKVGISGSPRPGDFKVLVKSAKGQNWLDASGTYPPGHPNNHYGKNWIGLEGTLCIHAVDGNTQKGHQGCIGLSEKDASDLYSILSPGSVITIR